MTTARCVHGRYAHLRHPCREATSPRTPARGIVHGGESKQDCLTTLCGLLGLPGLAIGVGSSVPSELFDAMADRLGVPHGSMPEIAEAVARKAGVGWSAACDSRGTLSGGGSTVTLTGLQRLVRAVGKLT